MRRASTYGVGRVDERVVHSNNLNIVVLNCIAEHDTTDATEAVDSNLDGHFESLKLLVGA